MTILDVVRAILDEARWAPSGDNTQPWRFEIRSAQHIVIHGFDTRAHCVYDLDGRASQLALGGLLESIRLASSAHGLRALFARRTEAPEDKPTFDVYFEPDAGVHAHPLAACLATRTVQRRAMGTRALTGEEKSALEESAGEDYRVHWLEGWGARGRMARLLWLNAGLRLTLPEAYEVHRSIIAWNARYSEDRIPDQALGASPVTRRIMRFALGSWARVHFLNRWLGGTIAPRVELDLIPGLACSAHFLISARRLPASIDDYVAAGRAMQRFWLTATSLQLQLQPQMTPLIFARYAVEQRQFSQVPGAMIRAQVIAHRLVSLFGPQPGRAAVFMGRIGRGAPARTRSLRLPLKALLKKNGPEGPFPKEP